MFFLNLISINSNFHVLYLVDYDKSLICLKLAGKKNNLSSKIFIKRLLEGCDFYSGESVAINDILPLFSTDCYRMTTDEERQISGDIVQRVFYFIKKFVIDENPDLKIATKILSQNKIHFSLKNSTLKVISEEKQNSPQIKSFGKQDFQEMFLIKNEFQELSLIRYQISMSLLFLVPSITTKELLDINYESFPDRITKGYISPIAIGVFKKPMFMSLLKTYFAKYSFLSSSNKNKNIPSESKGQKDSFFYGLSIFMGEKITIHSMQKYWLETFPNVNFLSLILSRNAKEVNRIFRRRDIQKTSTAFLLEDFDLFLKECIEFECI